MKKRNRLPLSEYRPLFTFKEEEKNPHFETQYIDEELLALAIEFYNEYFGYFKNRIDREEALAYADLGVRVNADWWKSMMPMSHDKIKYFYEITPSYFFHDVLRFMDGIHRANYDKWTTERDQDRKIESVLDFAGGTGGYSIMFAKGGVNVTFVDSNRIQCEWVRFVAKRLNIPITVRESLDGIEEKFDGIIAQDVVEHVFDPIVLVKRLHEFAKPNMNSFMSISEIPCCGPEEFAPMHFKVGGSLVTGEISFQYLANYKSMDMTLDEYRELMRADASKSSNPSKV